MVKLYTKKELVPENLENMNDYFFNLTTRYSDIRGIGKVHGIDVDHYMKIIDNAKIMDDITKIIEVEFAGRKSAIDAEYLSTGLKTILNLIYLIDKDESITLDISECGANALDSIFEIMDNYSGPVKIYLQHPFVGQKRTRQFLVDDKYEINSQAELNAELTPLLHGGEIYV